jgi:hypothetical protein
MAEQSKKKNRSWLVMALIVVVLALTAWYILMPGFALAVGITGHVFGVIIATLLVFIITILLLPVLFGIGLFVLGAVVVVWLLVAIILFPILFPIIIPVLVLLLFIKLITK